MIKKKSVLSVFSLFIVAMILLTAYADSATNTTTMSSSTKQDNVDSNVPNNYSNSANWTESALYDKSNESDEVQILLKDNAGDGIKDNYQNDSVEISKGNEHLFWNYTQYNSPRYGENGFGTLTVLAGPNPLNFTEKVNYNAILDAVGQEESQFGNIQHVTIYGIDDASVLELYGYGDCWADACWIYNKLSALGVPVRIMAYQDGGIDDGYRHTWIEVNIGNGWQTWDYKKYNSQHAGDNGYGTPYVLIEPGNAPADIMKTGY